MNEGMKVTINQGLRYGYAGFFFYFLAYLLYPDQIVEISTGINTLGIFTGPFVIFASGAAIYSFYRPLGDGLIFRIEAHFHRISDEKRSRGDLIICKRDLFEKEYGVEKKYSLEAVRIVRDFQFDEKIQKRYHVQHSEIHILYLTSFILIFGAVAAYLIDPLIYCEDRKASLLLVVSGVIFLIIGVILDMIVCRQECIYIHTLQRGRVRKALKDARLIKKP